MRLFLCLFPFWLSYISCYNYYYIVRHGEKGPTANPDLLTPLSDDGQERAHILRDTLLDKNIGIILADEFLRTQQMATPTAQQFNLGITGYQTSEGENALAYRVRAITDKNALIVGHSDNIPGLILALTGETVGQNGILNGFDNLFVIRRNRCDSPDTYTLYRRKYGKPTP